MSERMGGQGWSACQSIGLEQDGQLIAGVVYDYWNGASICMHVAASAPGWMTREYLYVCFAYPFEQLKVRRITGLVPESNAAARRLDEHLGFTLETRLSDAAPDGDVLVYRMVKADCRWLKLGSRYVQTQRAACA